MEQRKKEEQEFHNIIRSDELLKNPSTYSYYMSNKKYYSITRGSLKYFSDWLKEHCKNKVVLDYCCGDGRYSFQAAKYGANVIGIDISDKTIEICKKKAVQEKLEKQTSFFIMDAENLKFNDNSFDIIISMGVLHHLDLKKAYQEFIRVIKPNGRIICTEALGHNPFIHLYRKITPHLRTKWEVEHILSLADIKMSRCYFAKIKMKFFHLATLVAVPFRNLPGFNTILKSLETLDQILLSIPLIKKQAWMIIFILSEPRKEILKNCRNLS